MDMPMKGSKDAYFKCPSCGTELCAKEMPKKEDMGMKKPNASNMPMGDLRDKITKNPPAQPNMNSY